MFESSAAALIGRKFAQCHGARVEAHYAQFLAHGSVRPSAVLGYQRAGEEPLFVEHYLDEPVEDAVSRRLGCPIERSAIVEIGNLASENALATVRLWGTAANDLGADCEVAVATLTRPLRAMFARIGLDLAVLAPARPERVPDLARWGRYYETDPQVCAGRIADGQSAILAFLSRRRRAAA